MRATGPSTVFGLPAYNGEQHLAQALESLLTQRRTDFAVIVVDDCSTDRTAELVRLYAGLDPRITYERNERNLGLVRNWRRAFDLAVERYPGARFFAWASDHDVWHPSWLEVLAAELEAHPGTVLAYPQAVRIDDYGAEFPIEGDPSDTVRLSSPIARVRMAIPSLGAGGMIYGLARREALQRCGPFPAAVLPDRLHLVRLAVEGDFQAVGRRLWYRRYAYGVRRSLERQRRAFFRRGIPVWAYLPWWLVHTILFVRSLAGERRRMQLGVAYLVESLRYQLGRRRAHRELRRRRRRRSRRTGRRRRLRRWVEGAVRSRLKPSGAARAESAPAAPLHAPHRSAAGKSDPRCERAFDVYRFVRSRVRQMLESDGRGTEALGDLLNASPADIAALRSRSVLAGGVSSDRYRSSSAADRQRHAAKLRALRERGGDALLVDEAPLLGGFGYEIDGRIVNLDTLRYFEVLVALERAELLAPLGDEGGTIVEFGGRWGGFAYQFRTLFPRVRHVIVDRPYRLLLSAVYLLTAFPEARALFWPEVNHPGEADLLFVPESEVGSLEFGQVDLAVSIGSFEEMESSLVERTVDRLFRAGVPSLYSLNRDRTNCSSERPSVREILGGRYWLHEAWVLAWAWDQWIGEDEPAMSPKPNAPGGPVVYDPNRYHHLVGRRRLIAAPAATVRQCP